MSNSFSSKNSTIIKVSNLFKLVIEKLNVYPNSILHIGDRKRPDFLNPILNGMKSYKIKNRYINVKRNEYFTNNINLDKNIIYNLINNNILKEENSYSKLGYEVFRISQVNFEERLEVSSCCGESLFL